MGALIAFPGTDITMLGTPPSPRGKSLVIHQRACGDFVLMVEPRIKQSGWLEGWVARSAQDARRRAGDLCFQYPLLFTRIIDKTGTTRPTSAEAMAGLAGRD
jgi:hypothetical protein